jgi:glycosyltransferase involved in cell wall biosynthesis
VPDLSTLDVCIVAGTLGSGGAERQLYNMLRALRDAGARARVLSLNRGEFWERPIADLGVEVVWTGPRRSPLARLATIVARLRGDRPSVLQSQHFFTNLYVAPAARILGVPGIGALYNDVNREIAGVGRTLGTACLRAPRLIASNSRAAMADAVALGVAPARLHFLPNIVDVDRFAPAEDRSRRSDRPFTIVSVGRLVEQKRMDRLIGVVSRAARRAAMPMEIVIIGAGTDAARGALIRHARMCGLSPHHIEFKEPVHDLASCYRDADMFMLLSDWEGTSNALMEAMASALPVVSTAVGGARDLIAHGTTGFLFDPRDENGMVDAVVELARSSDLRARVGNAARAAMLAQHAPQRLPAYLSDLYGAAQRGSSPRLLSTRVNRTA